mgnify:CR=1 FL=1
MRSTPRVAMSTEHTLSCFTSTASLATLPSCTSSLAALLHSHLLPADVHFFTLATRRLCTSYPPSCTSYITRRLPLLTGRLATAALAARRPTLAALARHSLSAPHSCTCSTAPPCTNPLSACVFLSVPHQIRAGLVLSEVSCRCCTPRCRRSRRRAVLLTVMFVFFSRGVIYF